MIYTIVKYNKDEKTVESIFSFDAILSAQEDWSATVAKTTVESGFPISDHINVENPKFSISGRITSYSLYNSGSEIYWNGNDFVTRSKDNKLGFIEGKQALLKIFKARSYVRLYESTKNSYSDNIETKNEQLKSGNAYIFPNCVITSISFSSTEGSSSSFGVQVSLEQLNISSIVTTQLNDDEKAPRLFGYEKTNETTNSSTNSSNSNTGEVGSDVEVGKDNATSSKSADNSVMQELLKRQMKEGSEAIIRGKHAVEIRNMADKATAATGYPHRVIDYGDGSYSIIRVGYK